MDNWEEFGIAIARIILGMVVLILGLIALDLITYLATTGGSYGEKIAHAYNVGYDQSNTQTYHPAYREGYVAAYEKGYKKGYEIGQMTSGSEKRVPALVTLRNPGYKELKEFLERDKTDSKPYLPGEYVSLDFAVELNNNAERGGIRAAFVTVIFPEKSHGIVAFETTDKGLIYIEPQSDAEAKVAVGESYWRSAGGIGSDHYNDTVVEIQLRW